MLQLQRHAKVTGSSPVGTKGRVVETTRNKPPSWNYNSQTRKAFRRRHGVVSDFVQDHHVIPKQWRKHPSVLRFGLDINSSQNLIMMPTAYGKYRFRLRPERYTHDGGHHKYNVYTKEILDSLEGVQCEVCFRFEFQYLLEFFKNTLRTGEDIIPWK
jgi:hypothetical protein